MQLAKLTTPKKIKTLSISFFTFLVLLLAAYSPASAQDNSPYSRYGVGDLVSPNHISSRGMGGINAGFSDFLSINFNNPASYSSFQAWKEAKSKKLQSGRALLDVGINYDSRTLKEPGNTEKFTASNLLFSYLQIGVPLRTNWGMSFGLRPVSRISYKIYERERLMNPIPPYNSIDSAITFYEGKGGSYLASLGTGFSVFRKEKRGMEEKLSLGFNVGYLFGEKDYSTRRAFINDSVEYYKANYETRTNYSNLYLNAGLQYRTPVSGKMMLTIGAYGNWMKHIRARQDILRETFAYDESSGNYRIDSVYDRTDLRGNVKIPGSVTAGFTLQKFVDLQKKEGGWILGADFSLQNWEKYRFYGQPDALKNKWELKLGGQYNPVPKKSYFSQVSYRFGFFTGPDYVKSGQKLNQTGGSIGFALPLANYGRLSQQATIINVALEYIKRGSNVNVLKENLFRVSVGFSLSDIWFGKRKYE